MYDWIGLRELSGGYDGSMDLQTFVLRLVFLAVTIGGLTCALVGSWVAEQCGRRQTEGMVLGFLLGPFGVLVEALLPRK